MKITFLGTNGWYDTKTGNTICVLIETKNEYVILDAGTGIYKLGRHIKTKKPIYLFLSHFHLDHISGFHIINKFNFPQGIKVFGPAGLKKTLNRIVDVPYTVPIRNNKTHIRLCDFSSVIKSKLLLKYKKLCHSVVCYGYRLSLEDKVITFCTDTGVCDELYDLSKDADILITECSYKSGQRDDSWPHLNPEDAANTAVKAGVRKLVLTHFDADLYKDVKERKAAEKCARRIFKNTFASFDGMNITL